MSGGLHALPGRGIVHPFWNLRRLSVPPSVPGPTPQFDPSWEFLCFSSPAELAWAINFAGPGCWRLA
jgi:hypothetical protein